jgi:hypothetical protein
VNCSCCRSAVVLLLALQVERRLACVAGVEVVRVPLLEERRVGDPVRLRLQLPAVRKEVLVTDAEHPAVVVVEVDGGSSGAQLVRAVVVDEIGLDFPLEVDRLARVLGEEAALVRRVDPAGDAPVAEVVDLVNGVEPFGRGEAGGLEQPPRRLHPDAVGVAALDRRVADRRAPAGGLAAGDWQVEQRNAEELEQRVVGAEPGRAAGVGVGAVDVDAAGLDVERRALELARRQLDSAALVFRVRKALERFGPHDERDVRLEVGRVQDRLGQHRGLVREPEQARVGQQPLLAEVGAAGRHVDDLDVALEVDRLERVGHRRTVAGRRGQSGERDGVVGIHLGVRAVGKPVIECDRTDRVRQLRLARDLHDVATPQTDLRALIEVRERVGGRDAGTRPGAGRRADGRRRGRRGMGRQRLRRTGGGVAQRDCRLVKRVAALVLGDAPVGLEPHAAPGDGRDQEPLPLAPRAGGLDLRAADQRDLDVLRLDRPRDRSQPEHGPLGRAQRAFVGPDDDRTRYRDDCDVSFLPRGGATSTDAEFTGQQVLRGIRGRTGYCRRRGRNSRRWGWLLGTGRHRHAQRDRRPGNPNSPMHPADSFPCIRPRTRASRVSSAAL